MLFIGKPKGRSMMISNVQIHWGPQRNRGPLQETPKGRTKKKVIHSPCIKDRLESSIVMFTQILDPFLLGSHLKTPRSRTRHLYATRNFMVDKDYANTNSSEEWTPMDCSDDTNASCNVLEPKRGQPAPDTVLEKTPVTLVHETREMENIFVSANSLSCNTRSDEWPFATVVAHCVDAIGPQCVDAINTHCVDANNTHSVNGIGPHCVDAIGTHFDAIGRRCDDANSADCVDANSADCVDANSADCVGANSAGYIIIDPIHDNMSEDALEPIITTDTATTTPSDRVDTASEKTDFVWIENIQTIVYQPPLGCCRS
jgi:hypothetical protein